MSHWLVGQSSTYSITTAIPSPCHEAATAANTSAAAFREKSCTSVHEPGAVTWEIPRAVRDGRAQCQALLEKPDSQVLGRQEEMAS